MGTSAMLGCLLISNSSNLALLWPVSKRAHLLIVMVFSAFFWLLSILVVSTVGAIRPLRAFLPAMLPFGVLVQELFRWVYFKGYAVLCHLLQRGTPSIEFSIHEQLGIAVASGLGVAICHSLTFYVTLLAAGWGPGTYYTEHCPASSHAPMFLVSAVSSGSFSVAHVALMVLCFMTYEKRPILAPILVTLAHLVLSLMVRAQQTIVPIVYAFALSNCLNRRPECRKKLIALTLLLVCCFSCHFMDSRGQTMANSWVCVWSMAAMPTLAAIIAGAAGWSAVGAIRTEESL